MKGGINLDIKNTPETPVLNEEILKQLEELDRTTRDQLGDLYFFILQIYTNNEEIHKIMDSEFPIPTDIRKILEHWKKCNNCQIILEDIKDFVGRVEYEEMVKTIIKEAHDRKLLFLQWNDKEVWEKIVTGIGDNLDDYMFVETLQEIFDQDPEILKDYPKESGLSRYFPLVFQHIQDFETSKS